MTSNIMMMNTTIESLFSLTEKLLCVSISTEKQIIRDTNVINLTILVFPSYFWGSTFLFAYGLPFSAWFVLKNFMPKNSAIKTKSPQEIVWSATDDD